MVALRGGSDVVLVSLVEYTLSLVFRLCLAEYTATAEVPTVVGNGCMGSEDEVTLTQR